MVTVGVVVLGSLVATVGATAASTGEPKTQERPSSTWVQPDPRPLDGLGTFLYLSAPAPGPAQGSPLGYEYTLGFRFEDGSGGVLVLGHQHGRKVAGFGLLPGHLVATVPFDWSFGHAYLLFTYRLGGDQWGAWVFDLTRASWTFIAHQAAPAGAGGITPTSTTQVDYDPTLAPTGAADQSTCAFFPRVDAYFFAPIGWRGGTPSVATLGANAVAGGDCPTTTTTVLGWQHYRLGATASA